MSDEFSEDVTQTTESSLPIKEIPRDVALKICSGQVITSLAVALKELVENSIDAGATHIDIKFKDSGLNGFDVTDNGSGINPENFEAAVHRHSTSKLSSFDDLQKVETFGFRGEALNSLCALSDLVIITKDAASKLATRLEYDHKGTITKKTPTHGNVGTRIYVTNLFCTFPIRRREFERTVKKEFAKAIDMLTGYCLIFGNVKFDCSNSVNRNTSSIFNTSLNQSIPERMSIIFGTKEAEKITDISTDSPDVDDESNLQNCKLKGWVSKAQPGCGRSNKDRQYFYINSRPCDSKSILKCINDVYRQFNPHQFPIIVLNVEIDKKFVDINVTPDKRQLIVTDEIVLKAFLEKCLINKFKELQQIFEPVIDTSMKSIKQSAGNSKSILENGKSINVPSTLVSSSNPPKKNIENMIDNTFEFKKRKLDDDVEEPSTSTKKPKKHITSSVQTLLSEKGIKIEIKEPAPRNIRKPAPTVTKSRLNKNRNIKLFKHRKKVKLTMESFTSKKPKNETENDTQDDELEDSQAPVKITKDMFPQMKIIGQFNLGFILATINRDLFIVDQHAADEKYNFEDLSKNTVIQTQALVCPQQIKLSAINESILIQNMSIFEKNGFKFSVSEDAPSTERLHLTSRPFSKGVDFNKDDIEELIQLIQHATCAENVRPSKVRAMFASRACRKSIMIGDALKVSTMRKVVNNLSTLDNPWNCPHGRPTMKYLLKLPQI